MSAHDSDSEGGGSQNEDEILIYDGDKIWIPSECRKEIITELHSGHPGVSKMWETARNRFHWNGMFSMIKNAVGACAVCLQHRPAKQWEPLLPEERAAEPTEPMQSVRIDFGEFAGIKNLFVSDGFSGFLWVTKMFKTDANTTLKCLTNLFHQFGYPVEICADGGPPFDSHMYDDFLKENGIEKRKSSPGNVRSNGAAEAAVKNGKRLLSKCKEDGKDFGKALFSFNNTCRAGSTYSPADMLHTRLVRSKLPRFDGQVYNKQLASDDRRQVRENHNKNIPLLNSPTVPLKLGDPVLLQSRGSKLWDLEAEIVDRTANGRSYFVRTVSDGKIFLRSVRFIRLASMSVFHLQCGIMKPRGGNFQTQTAHVQKRVRFNMQRWINETTHGESVTEAESQKTVSLVDVKSVSCGFVVPPLPRVPSLPECPDALHIRGLGRSERTREQEAHIGYVSNLRSDWGGHNEPRCEVDRLSPQYSRPEYHGGHSADVAGLASVFLLPQVARGGQEPRPAGQQGSSHDGHGRPAGDVHAAAGPLALPHDALKDESDAGTTAAGNEPEDDQPGVQILQGEPGVQPGRRRGGCRPHDHPCGQAWESAGGDPLSSPLPGHQVAQNQAW